MDVEYGNVNKLDTQSTGWFIGFSDWTKCIITDDSGLRFVPSEAQLKGLCVKWMQHHKGDPRGYNKPVSIGRTVSILVSDTGGFRLEFCMEKNFQIDEKKSYLLQNQGDFVIWGSQLYHQAIVEKDSTILTIRWE
ncbi:MAG: hypothetical protein V7784_16990 [Oceanospirillaceae bacterium]